MAPGIIACKLGKPKKGWYPVVMTGEWKGHTNGAFTLDARALEQMRLNFESWKLDIVVDYEHQSLYGTEAPAAGWIKYPDGVRVQDEELQVQIAWSTRAKKRIKEGEYRYLSPVIIPHTPDPSSGEDVGWSLHSVALTNTPFFNELPPIAAKQSQSTHTKETPMPEKTIAIQEENEKLKAQLATKQKEEAERKVADAIAARSIAPKQKEWALSYAETDPSGFDAFLKDAAATPEVPQGDMFAASSTSPDTQIDVVAMAVGGAA